jgi:predicted MFS family arabinose efflux permease
MTEANSEPVKKARTSTLLSFLLCGIAVSSWAPMVPLAKQRTGLNEAGLGLILLAMGAGAIIAMPFVGPVIQKKGSRKIIFVSSIVTAATLPFLTIVDTPALLAVALFIFGASLGCLDVSMNAQAVVVQEKVKRHVMSSFHGMFSLGGLSGAMIFGLLLLLHISPFISAVIISVALIVLAILFNKNFLDHPGSDEAASFSFRFPKGPVLLLGIFCFIVFLAEGALLDWSALFLRFNRGFGISMAGVGYAVFSVSMAIMRFTGDNLVHKYGPQKMVLWGGLLAAAGLLIAIVMPWKGISLFGFLLIGIGAANIVPVLFSAAGKAGKTSPELALAAVTTMGYAGQIAGPALIGFAAQLFTLPVALGILAVPLIVVAVTFSYAKPGSSSGA